MKSHFDQQDEKLDELMEKTRETNQRFAGLEHEARQSHLTMEADVTPDTKTRKRMKDAAADRAKLRNSCSTKRVDGGPTSLTSFGMKAKSPALPSDGALVDKGAASPKPCISPVDARMLTAAGGLLPTGIASTATRRIFHQPTL